MLVITSTFGDGGPPDNGADFWERLESPDAPALDGIRYAVLGIGDRSYDNFCGHAKSIDTRLAALGATRLLDRAECEAYDDEPMHRWADHVAALLGDRPAPPSNGRRRRLDDRPAHDRRRAVHPRQTRSLAPLSRNVVLTAPRVAKGSAPVRLRHLANTTSATPQATRSACSPPTIPAVVDAWLAATGLRGEHVVEVDGAEQTLRDALIVVLRHLPGHPEPAEIRRGEQPRRQGAARAEGQARQVAASGATASTSCRSSPSTPIPTQWQEVLVRLTPRNYSISSSPLVSPHEVQLTVSVVRYRGADGGRRGGVCSTFLADRRRDGAGVPAARRRISGRRKTAATPMIMVGPGTGIAPFRGFLQERRALGHTGRNWLFFGDQHRSENFYYRDDLEDMVRDGFLNRLDLAFSRDQADRVYVQHKMLDYGADVWRWLDDGAHFYVCGDATRMAKDVDDALTSIIEKHGGMSHEKAHDYKRELVADKRYVRDVY